MIPQMFGFNGVIHLFDVVNGLVAPISNVLHLNG